MLLVALLAVLTPAALAQTTWYVDDNAPGDPGPGDPTVSDPLEDGSADHPFDAIQEGIDAAIAGDEVVVADGVYSGTGNYSLTFGGKDILVRSASGDPNACVIGDQDIGGDFYFINGESSAARLNGFTIQYSYYEGICCANNSNPTISNCIIHSNGLFGGQGGGVYCVSSSPTFNRCTIDNNEGGGGGGIYCRNHSQITFNDCNILNNEASIGGGVYCLNSNPSFYRCRISNNTGGGIYCKNSSLALVDCTISGNNDNNFNTGGICCVDSTPTLERCVITGNVVYDRGGAIYCNNSAPVIIECIISNNESEFYGGGVYCRNTSNPLLRGCIIRDNVAIGGGGFYLDTASSPTIENCLIIDNQGGGIFCWNDSNPILNNCTVADNVMTSDYSGSLDCRYNSNPTLTNCVLWGNAPPDIRADESDPVLTYCAVEGGWPGTGNLDVDPLLTHDGHLRAGSPCYNAGTPEGVPPDQTDIDGEPRVIDGRVDIGADEWLDSDGDGLPDWWEILYFGDPVGADPEGDEDFDGQNNLIEYVNGTNPFGPRTFYVDPTGNDDWDGLAPEWNGIHGPKATIQAAIDATHPTEGDEVLLADGVYSGVGNRDLDLNGKTIVVRSSGGDPQHCMIDCMESGRGFQFRSGETSETLVSGLTIQNSNNRGIYIVNNSSPTFDNCVIRNCQDGGVLCSASNPTFSQCSIIDNHAYFHAGGICCQACDNVVFNNCTISGNISYNPYGGVMASGGCYSHNSNVTFTNCTISDNYSIGHYGGGCFFVSGSVLMNNCIIRGNYADDDGGGIYSEAARMTLTNCSILDNSATNGGGFRIHTPHDSSLINCTISGNHAEYSGGISCDNPADLSLNNCIVWNNLPQSISVAGNGPYVSYSDVQGGWPGIGNLAVDPLFVDPDGPDNDPATWEDNDYRLLPGSPCIDAGDNDAVPPDVFDLDGDGNTTEPTPFDLDGNPRFADDAGMPDRGTPGSTGLPVVDMGAYEFQGRTCFADLTGDNRVGLADLAQLLGHYAQTAGMTYYDGDLNADGAVDLDDLAEMLSRYGDVCP